MGKSPGGPLKLRKLIDRKCRLITLVFHRGQKFLFAYNKCITLLRNKTNLTRAKPSLLGLLELFQIFGPAKHIEGLT